MALREANSITACATPLALHFPCDALTVRVLPLKLQVKGNRIFRGATRLLEGRCAPRFLPRPMHLSPLGPLRSCRHAALLEGRQCAAARLLSWREPLALVRGARSVSIKCMLEMRLIPTV